VDYQKDFQVQLYQVMSDRAPKLLRWLQKSGQLQKYLEAESQKAFEQRRELLRRHQNPGLREKREVDEQVRALFLEFPQEDESPPPEFPEPPFDLPSHPGSQGRQLNEHRTLMSKVRTTRSRPAR